MAPTHLQYLTLDVFTRIKYNGNPLAVVKVPADITLDQKTKQTIAREFNYSETVFLHERQSEQNVWKVDIFLTTRDIAFAGHPTIGTAYHVLSQLSRESPDDVISGTFITKAGPIKLQFSKSEGVTKALIPHDTHIHQSHLPRLEILRIHPSIPAQAVPEHWPVVSIVKGLAFALVKLDTLDSLGSVTTTPITIDTALDEGWEGSFIAAYFYVELPDSADGTRRLRTRMVVGSLEDPATGSAATTLASYLALQEGHPRQKIKYDLIQGVEMGRESQIGVEVTLSETAGVIDSIELSGPAVHVMEGSLSL